MTSAKQKILSLSKHLLEVDRLVYDLYKQHGLSLCLWPKEVQIGIHTPIDGLEIIKNATGIEPVEQYPYGLIDDTYHKTIVVNGINYFQCCKKNKGERV